jgi:hypothetical protein
VTETANANNSNSLAGADVSSDKRRVSSDASAEKRGNLLSLESLGDLKGEVLVCADVRSETTMSDAAIRVFAVVSVDHIRAVVLVLVLAKLALKTRRNLGSNTHTVSNLDILDLIAYSDSLADNFVTDAERTFKVSPAAGNGVDIRAADTTGVDLDIDIAISPGLGGKGVLLKLVP